MEEMILKNGLKVVYHPMPNTHSVSVALYVKAGARYEEKHENGITHFLEHLHFRELQGLSQKELYYQMESMGSTLRGVTYAECLRFYMKILPKYLAGCLDIFSKILCTYNWSLEPFEKEKQVVLNQIDEKNSYTNIDPFVIKTVYDSTESIMGTHETIKKMNIRQLIEYKRKVFNKNNMMLCIYGAIDETDINLIKHKLEGFVINDGTENTSNVICSRFFNRKPDVVFEKASWDFLDVNISFDIDYNCVTYDEILMLNCILGGGDGSRLQGLIREELGYTSDIYSEVSSYNHFSVLHIKYTVHRKLLYDSLLSIVQILNEIKRNITYRDLDVTLPFFDDNASFEDDDPEEKGWRYVYDTFLLENPETNDHLAKDAYTLNRMMEIAKYVFRTNNACIVVLGNCNGLTKKSIKDIFLRLD